MGRFCRNRVKYALKSYVKLHTSDIQKFNAVVKLAEEVNLRSAELFSASLLRGDL